MAVLQVPPYCLASATPALAAALDRPRLGRHGGMGI